MLVTGHEDESKIKDAMINGLIGILHKPAKIQDLLNFTKKNNC